MNQRRGVFLSVAALAIVLLVAAFRRVELGR